MEANDAKRKLFNLLKHFPQVSGVAVKTIKDRETLVVLLEAPMESFAEEFEGFSVKTEVIGKIKALKDG